MYRLILSARIIIGRKSISACNENKQPAVMLTADKTIVKNGRYFSYPHLCNQELWDFLVPYYLKTKN
jgi:hypothetical protein